MRFDEVLDWLRDGRWVTLVGVAVVVIAVVLVGWVAWPQIKPRPKPQAQSLSTVVTTSAAQPASKRDESVPEEVVEQIAEDLGISDLGAAAIRWEDEDHKVILVREQEGALEWKEHRFVKRDGRWVRK